MGEKKGATTLKTKENESEKDRKGKENGKMEW